MPQLKIYTIYDIIPVIRVALENSVLCLQHCRFTLLSIFLFSHLIRFGVYSLRSLSFLQKTSKFFLTRRRTGNYKLCSKKFKFPPHADKFTILSAIMQKTITMTGPVFKQKSVTTVRSLLLAIILHIIQFFPTHLFIYTKIHRTISVAMFWRPRHVVKMAAPDRNYEFEITIKLLNPILLTSDTSNLLGA